MESVKIKILMDEYEFVCNQGVVTITDFDPEAEFIAYRMAGIEADFRFSAFIAREVVNELSNLNDGEFTLKATEYKEWLEKKAYPDTIPNNLPLSWALNDSMTFSYVLKEVKVKSEIIDWWCKNLNLIRFPSFHRQLEVVASSTHTSYANLRKIALVQYADIERGVLGNPLCDKPLLLEMMRARLKSRHFQQNILQAWKGRLPHDVAYGLCRASHMHVRRQLASMDIDNEVMEILSRDTVNTVRASLAANRHLSDELKILLSTDASNQVLTALCQSKKLPQLAIENLKLANMTETLKRFQGEIQTKNFSREIEL